MDNYIIYLLTDKTNGKIYIGLTQLKIDQRWCNSKLCERFGHFNFNKEILFSHLNKDGAVWYEKAMIFEYNSTNPDVGYNKSKGGGLIPDETRLKMSQDRKGVKKSEEHRKNLTIANRNKSNDPEFKERHRLGTLNANKNEDKRKRASITHQQKWKNEEFRERRIKEQQNVAKNPEWKKKQKDGIVSYHEKNKFRWWTNGIEDRRILLDESPPDGYWRGRKIDVPEEIQKKILEDYIPNVVSQISLSQKYDIPEGKIRRILKQRYKG